MVPFGKLTVAMMEMSSRTRKKAKHKGIMTSQSLRPESHCASVLGSTFPTSDIARSASVATDLEPVSANLPSPKSPGIELCFSADADSGEVIVDIGILEVLLVGCAGRFEGLGQSRQGGAVKLLIKSVKCRRRLIRRRLYLV